MGLLDRAYLDAGFEVVPGCEIDSSKRAMYAKLCGGEPIVRDLKDLPAALAGEHFDGIIGGPSCQDHSKLRAMRKPKFPDLTPGVLRVLEVVDHDWFNFENVVPINIPGAAHTRLNAMHFYKPHQSRVRWFTHSASIAPPPRIVHGQRRRPDGIPGRGRADLRSQARRAPAGLPRGVQAAVPLCPTAARSGRRCAVPAGTRLGTIHQITGGVRMTCAKTTVRCTIVAVDGRRFVGTNYCENPQPVCPRAPGEGYEKCATICRQVGHAEPVAVALAGEHARGGRAYIEGHTYACMNCQHALFGAGVISFTVGAPPEVIQ